MKYPKTLQEKGNFYRMYTELALEEYRIGNVRHANTLYRRGKKYVPVGTDIPRTISIYVALLNMKAEEVQSAK